MGIVAIVAGLGWLVCWVLTLIKIFQDKEKNGVVHGIIGILCGIWAFIWGWINSGRYGNKQIMIAWTICIVLYFIAGGSAVMDAINSASGK